MFGKLKDFIRESFTTLIDYFEARAIEQSKKTLRALIDETFRKEADLLETMRVAAMREQAWLDEAAQTNPVVDQMLGDSECIVEFLCDPDPEVRYWAVICAGRLPDSETSPELHSKLEYIAFYDPRVSLRCDAINAIAWLLRSPRYIDRIKALGRRLAEIVENPCDDERLRKAAYKGLLVLERDPAVLELESGANIRPRDLHEEAIIVTQSRTRRLNSLFEPSVPDGIDWEYVRSWLGR